MVSQLRIHLGPFTILVMKVPLPSNWAILPLVSKLVNMLEKTFFTFILGCFYVFALMCFQRYIGWKFSITICTYCFMHLIMILLACHQYSLIALAIVLHADMQSVAMHFKTERLKISQVFVVLPTSNTCNNGPQVLVVT
jgi:hypothetical protein